MTRNLVRPVPVDAFPLNGDDAQVLIDGKWHRGQGAAAVAVLDPSVNELLFEVTPASTDQVEEAVESSRKAFRGAWATMPGLQKGNCISRLAGLMRENVDTLAELEARNTGIPIAQSRFEVESAARHLEYFAGFAGKIEGMSADLPDGRLMYGVREPLGVVAQVVPWNSPLKLLARGCAAALACGNTVVIKPSIVALASVLALGKLIDQAGFPPGVVNIVPGKGRTVGAALVRHPGVRKVVFTGGTEGGEEVLLDAARNVTPVLAELGGKGPIIVGRDIDVDEVAAGVMSQAFARQGQVCFAGTRLFVPTDLRETVVDRLVHFAAQMRIGDAMDPTSQMGPLISATHLQSVVDHIDGAVSKGATLVCGGAIEGAPGNFVRPTVLTDVDVNQPIASEEVFGPVLVVHDYDQLDEAVEDANNTKYGLAAYVWSNDIREALTVTRRLESGNVFVNTYRYASEVPFGGSKQSGLGREHGSEALREYTELKTVVIGMARWTDAVLSR
jgi:acyl-CoA reductase-like NAD-dependent aldehyde dehydrogenase